MSISWFEIEDQKLKNRFSVGHPIDPGSLMKTGGSQMVQSSSDTSKPF